MGVVKPPLANTSHAKIVSKVPLGVRLNRSSVGEMAGAPSEVPETAQPIHARDEALL